MSYDLTKGISLQQGLDIAEEALKIALSKIGALNAADITYNDTTVAEALDGVVSGELATDDEVAEAIQDRFGSYMDGTDDTTSDDSTATTVSSVEDLKAALADESISTISLDADIEATNGIALVSGAEKTLNLSGHSITVTDSTDSVAYAIGVGSGSTLTINADDDTTVYGGSGSEDNIAVWASGEGTKVIINGGTYDVGVDSNERNNSTIYANEGAEIVINGGTFKNSGNGEVPFVLNIQNGSGSKITCYGGTFIGQNPADGDDEDKDTGATFLADGYTVETSEEDGKTAYTVVAA